MWSDQRGALSGGFIMVRRERRVWVSSSKRLRPSSWDARSVSRKTESLPWFGTRSVPSWAMQRATG